MSQTPEPVSPVPAATILLLRPSEKNIEVFMVVRHHQIDFASGALVFPGGKADKQDFDDALIPLISSPNQNVDMRGAEVSAIREAFEECGILLAYEQGTKALIDGQKLESIQHYREPLNAGEIKLEDFLKKEELVMACDQLTRFAHWITPEMMPKRFDTHFYLALAPKDHVAVHDGYESVDSVWIDPAQAVSEAKTGKRTIIFPTRLNLEMLATWQTPLEAIEATKGKDIVSVLPWTEKRDDGNYLCIPPEAGYTVSEEKMPDRGMT
ncbi:NUDIX hydrolase [Gammaproteobacteria bacterium]|nr:NUDIX hydrolase [Gammaproteobacteria bacterium]